MFVYLITNTINGKRYVGQTRRTLSRRWKQHCDSAGCCALNGAIKKHGAENFIIEVICEPLTFDLMNEFEAEYIVRYNTLVPNGYNLTTGGLAPQHSEETKRKLSAAQKGRKASLETKKKMSLARKGVAHPMSEEATKALIERNKGNTYGLGRKNSEEHRRVLRRPRSLETKQRMSGPKSAEHRRKIGLAHVGMKRSPEAIANMKAAQQARRLNELNAAGESRS